MRKSLVFGLRLRNVDVVTATEANMLNRSDEDHLAVASTGGRTLVSYNIDDYCAPHQDWLHRGRTHAGIIDVTQQQYSVGEELRRTMRLISRVTAEQM